MEKRSFCFLFQLGMVPAIDTYNLRFYNQKTYNTLYYRIPHRTGRKIGFKYILQVTFTLGFLTKLNIIAPAWSILVNIFEPP